MLLEAQIVLAVPRLQVIEPVWNVGMVVVGVEQNRSFEIVNIGDELLVIEDVEQCCGFHGKLETRRLLPGEHTKLHVRLKPVKMVGDLLAEIFLVSNDPKLKRFPVTAVGSVLPTRHALGELVSGGDYVDLGVMLPGDPVAFSIRIKNVGNEPLRIARAEKGKNVHETGARLVVLPGEESDVPFRYVAERSGPIDEQVVLVTNDALNRTLQVPIKGYVAKDWLPDRAVVIYPVGIPAHYDAVRGTYRYEVVVENRSGSRIELGSFSSSLPQGEGQVGGGVESNQKATVAVTYPVSILQNGPVSDQPVLQIILPTEVR